MVRSKSHRTSPARLLNDARGWRALLTVGDEDAEDDEEVAVVSQVGPVSREFLEPYPVGHVPGYVLSKIADGIRMVTGI